MTRDEVIAGLMAAGSDAATPEKYLCFFAEATTLLTVDAVAKAVIGPDDGMEQPTAIPPGHAGTSPSEVANGQGSASTITDADIERQKSFDKAMDSASTNTCDDPVHPQCVAQGDPCEVHKDSASTSSSAEAYNTAKNWLHLRFGTHSGRDMWAGKMVPEDFDSLRDLLTTFAAARVAEAVARERDACAQTAELCTPGFTSRYADIQHDVKTAIERANMIAAAIRARKL